MLPIGSIVYLRQGTNKLIILNRGPIIEKNGKQTLFDYSGCFYPQGVDPENTFYFNEENIDEVVYEGYKDDDEARFQKLFNDWKEENKNDYVQGKVTEPLE